MEIGNSERKLLRFKFKPNTFPSLGENQWLISMEPQQVLSDQAQCHPGITSHSPMQLMHAEPLAQTGHQ